jgi:hypothetical protein
MASPGFFDIQSVLGVPQLQPRIKARASSTPRPLPNSFYESKPSDVVIRNNGMARRTYGQQQGAAITGYGSAARTGNQVATQMVPIVTVHTFEKLEIKMTDYVGLLEPDSSGSILQVDETGINYIGEQIAEFQSKFLTTRNTITGLTLVQDAVYVAQNGSILPTSSGSMYTISSGVAASHQGQLNNGTSSIISTPWSDANADIPKQILSLRQRAAQDFAGDGPNIEYAIYGKNVPSYLFNNPYLVKYLQFNEAQNIAYIANGKIPDQKMVGIQWIDASTMFFRSGAGSGAFDANSLLSATNTTGIQAPGDGTPNLIVGDDQVIFCPDPAKVPWFKTIEGHYPVPQKMLAANSPMEMLNSTKLTRGMFAYAGVSLNPLGIDIYMGDNFYPFIAMPNAIYQSTVVYAS